MRSVIVLWAVVGTALAAEPNPPFSQDQVDHFMQDILEETRTLIFNHRILPDTSYEFERPLFTYPLVVSFSSEDRTLIGPSQIKLFNEPTVSELPSGNIIVHSVLDLGKLEMRIGKFKVEFMSFKYEGSLSIIVENIHLGVTFRMYQNRLTRCQVTTSVSPLNADYFILPGTEGGFVKVFIYLVEKAFAVIPGIPLQFLQRFVFPDAFDTLRGVLRAAATHAACS